ncbi:carboxylating nicotinate-nucleotide diphosphorylase [Bacillus suaedae]|uniref:Probable nicotinate-nucleotide pyrophosphorylase [carboxylating] n=1 Tax=Halalkalibacter suaedae TaxID=2822140 RepID=A0A940WZ75_9BACI|nr:carboxylating nicotinate-nucleotide diphosphorylase [Bacillus suaedae]MBP3951420.1 carboxylating nicotinate-nucleotide diphosphorylase [Bacillus suaedae]
MNHLLMKKQLEHFFIEDIAEGDVTTESIIGKENRARAMILAKENGIMAGSNVVTLGYELIDRSIKVDLKVKDGDRFKAGEVIGYIEGPVCQLLAGERVILNLLQRMSGIASLTNAVIKRLNDPTIRICDTRKTTPGLRQFEKYAVRCGGGYNHRRTLSDAVLLKENHLLAGGGILKSVESVRSRIGHMVKIEVETTNELEVLDAIEAKVDVIMFDNASPAEVLEYVKLVPHYIRTEVSGGINIENIENYRGCGCDYISLGALTHSVKATDLSFLLLEGEV